MSDPGPGAQTTGTSFSSRWYFPFYEGLAEGKHVTAMGQAVWLYLWMLSRAWVAQKEGEFKYCHLEAAEALDTSERNIRRWFNQLQECGYIELRARGRYDMDVAITKWRSTADWLTSRDAGGGVHLGATRTDKSVRSQESSTDKSVRSGADVPQSDARPDKSVRSEQDIGSRTDTRTDIRTDKSVRPHISIRLEGYSYPEGPGATRQDVPDEMVSLRHLFADLKERLATSTNKPAVLRTIYQLCFGGPEENLPDYGYVGTVARGVGDEGSLAESMWQLTAKEQRNDPLAWLLAWHKQRRSEKGRRNGQSEELPTAEQWRARAQTKGAIRRAENSDQ